MAIITLAEYQNLQADDLQSMFNHILEHLAEQNQQCIEDDTCAYRNSQGLACAVGCLIPNELYKPIFELSNCWALYDRLAGQDDYAVLFSYPTFLFLQEMQKYHDRYYCMRSREECLEYLTDVANKYGLSMPNIVDQW